MTDNKKGFFITFEGIDGCGKTTQLNLVKDYLVQKGYNVLTTLEPGDSEIGKNLRQTLLHHKGFVSDNCELFLYLADRSQHVDEIILPNIKKGTVVLCDRYTDSTIAYQGFGRGKNIKNLNFLNDIATGNLEADITFLFDIDIEIAQKRVGKIKDRLESEGEIFHKKVKEGYLELQKKYPNRIKLINANKSIQDVFKQVKEILDEKL